MLKIELVAVELVAIAWYTILNVSGTNVVQTTCVHSLK